MKLSRCFSLFCIFLLLIGFDVFAQSTLIPQPISLKLNKGHLSLINGVDFSFDKEQFKDEFFLIQSLFKEKGISVSTQRNKVKKPSFFIDINPTLANEAYGLLINAQGIRIKAKTKTGVFYAIQTLKQFDFTDQKIAFCQIEDEPAFSWRGFLVDVGRNFQPVELLKEQIEVMSRYKLNVFHFHFTEDIAWRLFSPKYPGLTEAKNMTRWVGKFYSLEDFRALIDFCKARHILFLPEIDMPGHSAAFSRYFGHDMQSDSGMIKIKELLAEFKNNFPDLKTIHIGGDEVRIHNKDFIPEITKYVEDLGYKSTLGWSPGSNLLPQSIRQLWMGGPKAIEAKEGFKFVDSKHLYLNHIDPLETVTTLFFRKIGEQPKETLSLLGATLCSWPDRAVAKPEDMFLQSAVYPGMITFAERSWRGGGNAGWTANLPAQHTSDFKDFVNFENRLLIHKAKYFKNKDFPYVKQQNITWDLLGSFDNQGDLKQSFDIEKNPWAKDIKVVKHQIGGTVILRHWWNDFIKGAIDQPKDKTTWYARTKIWSDKAIEKPFWIGFNDLSRSYASDTPDAGTWDNRQSKVLVNGQEVKPPLWKNAGMKGNMERPLVDEGYSYRKPTLVQLKKGWNTVLIKLPVKNFSGKDWQNPEKWMFTFVEAK